MSVVINIVLILASILLIVVVLMQEGNKQGLGVIGGAAETFLGKNKAKSYEGKLLLITKVLAAVFVVLAILATWMNARTYSVTYFVENEAGEKVEYFPYAADYANSYNAMIDLGLQQGDYTSYEAIVAGSTEENLRARTSYSRGDEIIAYSTPVKEGYIGTWVTEDGNALPEKMGGTNYVMTAKYEIGTYTVTVKDMGVNGDAEDGVLFTMTDVFGTAIEYPENVKLPEAIEGYRITWSSILPETIPGADTVINVVYEEGNYISYFDEEGNELFPYVREFADTMASYNNLLEHVNMSEEEYAAHQENHDDDAEAAEIAAKADEMYNELVASATAANDMNSLRQFVAKDSEIKAYDVPAKEGFVGAWEPALPEIMDGQAYQVKAVYTEAPAEEAATEEAAAEAEAPAETPAE